LYSKELVQPEYGTQESNQPLFHQWPPFSHKRRERVKLPSLLI